MRTRRKHARATVQPGWTLMECLLAVAIMALVFAAAAPLLQKAGACYSEADPRLSIIHEGRIGLATFAREFRQGRALTQPAWTGRTDSRTYFVSDANESVFYGLVTTESPYVVKYGRPGLVRNLAFNCTSLWLDCYAADGTVLALPGADPTAVRMVEASLTVADPNGRAEPVTFTTRARIRRDLPTVVINEIMYKPSGDLGAKDKNQWVELYNPTAQAVDVAGWRLWTKDQPTPDILVADPLYSTGSTVIPAGGYAVITDTDSELYRDKLKNGDFEKGSMSDWNSTSDWTATAEDKVSGTYSARYYGTGWNRMYQDFKIDSSAVRARVRVWERANPGYSTPNILIRVTNRSSTVFATLYDGPCHEEWTAHTADLTAYINRDARLEIWGYRSGVWDAYVRVDAAVIQWNKHPSLSFDAQHLWVNSSVIGKNLEDQQIFLASGNVLRDAAVFEKSWGGDGNGSTLSRTSPWAPPTESEAWTPGPYGGTPGAVNP